MKEIKKRNRLFYFGIIIAIAYIFLWNGEKVYAQNVSENEKEQGEFWGEDSIDFDMLQNTIDEVIGESEFSFHDYMMEQIESGSGFSFLQFAKKIEEGMKQQIKKDKGMLFRVLGIIFLGSVFTAFTKVFRNGQVSELGFYITYLLLFSILCVAFREIMALAEGTMQKLLEFMRSMVPAYYTAITLTGQIGTSTLFYQVSLFLIHLVEIFIVKGIFPIIQITFLISLANSLSKEEPLSKAVEVLQKIVSWSLKSVLGLVTGYNVINRMLVPIADQTKNHLVMKLLSGIPGIGSVLSATAQTVLGAGTILRNVMGVAGICVLLLILCVPLARIGIFYFLSGICGALVQPVADSRIVSGLEGCKKAVGMLLFACSTAAVLFLLTIVVVMSTMTGTA